jgi:hypothetical protein
MAPVRDGTTPTRNDAMERASGDGSASTTRVARHARVNEPGVIVPMKPVFAITPPKMAFAGPVSECAIAPPITTKKPTGMDSTENASEALTATGIGSP